MNSKKSAALRKLRNTLRPEGFQIAALSTDQQFGLLFSVHSIMFYLVDNGKRLVTESSQSTGFEPNDPVLRDRF